MTLSDYKIQEKEAVRDRAGGICEVCGKHLDNNLGDFAHILGNTKSNLKRYGIDFIWSRYNINLSQHAFSITKRRIENFFAQYNVPDLQVLFNFLEKEKFWISLFEYLIIPTTEMFRDYEVWAKLKRKILPKLSGQDEIKIWIPEVSSDDELLTLLIVLKELNLIEKTKITISSEFEKIDEIVRKQKISEKKYIASEHNYLTYLPNGEFENYFTKSATNICFNNELFENVVYKKHSFSNKEQFEQNFDLILFRNRMLIYGPLMQKTALDIIYNSLRPKGYLLVGLKETLKNWTLKGKFSVSEKDIGICQKKR